MHEWDCIKQSDYTDHPSNYTSHTCKGPLMPSINFIIVFQSCSTVHIAKSTHDGVDTLGAKLALLAHIHTGLGVVGANDAPGLLLQVEGSFPGLVYVLGRVVA